MDKRGYRPAQAAEYTGFPRSTVYEAIQRGDLRSFKVGRARLMLREDLDAWLDQQTANATPDTAP